MTPTILAIDYGTTRLGLAINRFTLAEPLAILAQDSQLLENLAEIIETEQVDLILVGLSENQMAEKTRIFAQDLADYTGLPVEFTDETLSSKEVEKRLIDSPVKLSKKQGPIDHYAAAVFLQEWLDEQE